MKDFDFAKSFMKPKDDIFEQTKCARCIGVFVMQPREKSPSHRCPLVLKERKSLKGNSSL